MSHANRGKLWESRLESQHSLYQWRGEAYCQRNYPPVQVIGRTKGAQFTGVWTGGGPPDWTIITKDRTFVLDAKQCGGDVRKHGAGKRTDRWTLANIHDHQAEAFEDAVTHAALGGVLLWHTGANTCFVLLWDGGLRDVWKTWKREAALGRVGPGTASLALEDLETAATWYGHGTWDWLPSTLDVLDGASQKR